MVVLIHFLLFSAYMWVWNSAAATKTASKPNERGNIIDGTSDILSSTIIKNCRVYRISTKELRQPEAAAICRKFGMDLISIRTKEKNSILVDVMSKTNATRFHTSAMKRTDDAWAWADAEAMTFTNWLPNEPNNYLGMEYCMEVVKNGLWNDYPCHFLDHFICEGPVLES